MVFLSLCNFGRNPGPTAFWRKRRILLLSAHFRGRKRNCYSIAIRYVQRALVYARIGRKVRKLDNQQLYAARVSNASQELGLTDKVLMTGLERSNIYLTKDSLSTLSIWEPRTFKALANFAWSRSAEEGLANLGNLGAPPAGVITRGMIKS